MTWEDYIQRKIQSPALITRIKTDVECPRCGRKIWKRVDTVLLSNPPQYQYECDCGWVGYHTV